MIAIRQFEKLYNYYLIKILKDGRVPTIGDVMAFANDELPQISGEIKPIFSYIPQTSDSIFDINLYNSSLDKLKFDLEILFEEIEEIEVKNLGRIMHADLFHAANTYEIKKLSAVLDSLLFAIGGADQAFHAQFETFNSLEKTNIEESTKNIVDLSEKVIALPMLGAGTMRIDMSHLYDQKTVPVVIDPSNLSVAGTVPQSSFGNILKDDNGVWAVIVESDSNVPVSISFTVALPREERINRVTLVPHSIKAQKAYVSYSVDNVNVRDIPEYASGVELADQATVVALDFDERLVEFLHITLEKSSADEEVESGQTTKFQYIFGLKNLSAWIGGRNDVGTYVSKPFQFKDDLEVIGKIAISANEEIPQDTQVNWSIALTDEEGVAVTPFAAIKPQNHPDESGPPKIIVTSEAKEGSLFFNTGNIDSTNLFVFNSIQFHQLVIADEEPVYGTGSLLRGLRAWNRNIEGKAEGIVVQNNFIDFAEGTSQNLYAVTTEATSLRTSPDGGGESSTSLEALLSKPVLNATYFSSFTASGGVGVSADANATPNFSIYSVTLQSTGGPVEVTGVFPFDNLEYDLGTSSIDANSVAILKVDIETGNIIETYLNGVDYVVDSEGAFPTGKILAVPNSSFDPTGTGYDPPVTGETWKISYTIAQDITRFVSSIIGSKVLFSADMGTIYDTYGVEIKYRHFADSVVKSSLQVKNELGPVIGDTIVYSQGSDYVFDSATNAIQRLPSGNIPLNAPVYVDYSYEIPSLLQEYTIWCKIENSDGVEIMLKPSSTASLSNSNHLIPNTEAGEALFVSIAGIGVVDITEAIVMPKLTGWVQFIVRSLTPFITDADGKDILEEKVPNLAFIDQVIGLKDEFEDYLFVEGGKYFSEIAASRQPLAQVSLPFLKTNVLKAENSYFAVDPVLIGAEVKYSIVVNYIPDSQIDIYSYVIDPTDTTDSGSLIYGHAPKLVPEEYKFAWTSKIASEPSTGVIVKTELSRNEDAPGNATPKVSSFFIKVSY
jgi:hypothetical protein